MLPEPKQTRIKSKTKKNGHRRYTKESFTYIAFKQDVFKVFSKIHTNTDAL